VRAPQLSVTIHHGKSSGIAIPVEVFCGGYDISEENGGIRFEVGGPDDPDGERQKYQKATLVVSGLCFLSIDPPSSKYSFLPDGKPICVSGDPAKPDNLPSLPDLAAKLLRGSWCYRFFVHDWNAFIHIAARDAQVTWVGEKPKHAA
jgi:hypothetical protein